MTDLLTAVDALTLPEHAPQKDDNGKWLKALTAPCLLERMREAVMPMSSEQGGGSPSAAHTRSPGDLEAMYQYSLIASQIGDWCRMAGIRSQREPVQDLRAWYVTTLTNPVSDWYRRKLQSWATVIRNHLDPVTRTVYLTVGHVLDRVEAEARGRTVDVEADVRSAKARGILPADWGRREPLTPEARVKLAQAREKDRQEAVRLGEIEES